MRAIQSFLPNPRHTEIHRIFVQAKPAEAWQVARHFDAAEIPWVKLLFDIRTLPERFAGKHEGHEPMSVGVDEVVKNGSGFMLLTETPGKEVVVGSVGQFWHLNIPFNRISPEDFTDFTEPGWGKLAWAIAVEPYLEGSTVSIELRTTATDERSWNKLSNYFRFIGVGSHLIRSAAMKHLEALLGKMKLPDDASMPLPGDEIIANSRYAITHDVVIEAPVSLVWRYLMQLGCDRAGWYSIDLLDHGGLPSMDFLNPEWTDRHPGDRLSATLALDSFFDVYQVETNRHFVIGGESEKAHGLLSPFKMTWAFVLEPIGEDATRLLVRARMKAAPAWAEWLAGNVFYPPVHGLMSGVQLKTIKQLAERDAHSRKEEMLVLEKID
ncbi:MAG: SRPBCC family protein [Saprospiraceae bacterium]|nr:SRPBCC family protein [Saprospiraceae bacterium]